MPIRLITGLPGNGKTAFLVSELLSMEVAQVKRNIYVCGVTFIRDFELNIKEVGYKDIENWGDFDDGSLIIVDEAQHAFPTRSASKPVPAYIKAMSEHRHRGFDFILLTQDPRNLDAYCRRLISNHRHIKRLFGSMWQAVFIWERAKDDPTDKRNHTDAVKKISRLPKKVFGFYESASEHNIKLSVPFLFYFAVLFVFAFPALGYFLFSSATSDLGSTEKKPDSDPVIKKASVPAPVPKELQEFQEFLKQKKEKPKPRKFDNSLFIDQDLIFLEGLKTNGFLYLNLVLVDEKRGFETQLFLEDLKAEPGLQFSLVTGNKLLLKQDGRKRVLYRMSRPAAADSSPEPVTVSEGSAELPGGFKIPF